MEQVIPGQFLSEPPSHQSGLPYFNPKFGTEVDVLSFACLVFVAVSTLAIWNRNSWKQSAGEFSKSSKPSGNETRCVIQKMEKENKNCVVFFGSQTGNGEDFAERLVKEGHSRFNLNTMIADLDDYDYTTLNNFPSDKVAIFILSSYGEGEPTDNAATFFDFITSDEVVFSDDQDFPLQSMRFAAFGLGNSTYEHFNGVVRKVESSLQRLGATAFTDRGEGDDGKGTQEDDFLAWKEVMWDSLKNIMHLHEQEEKFEPNFSIVEKTAASESIFLGERCQGELMGTPTEHGPHSPYVAKVLESKELFESPDRNCLHIDIDLRGSGLSYETGDHVAVWPSNSDIEVDRFLRVFGLAEKRLTVIHISAQGSVKSLPCPSPTTYEAAVRYYMEICGPISRQFLTALANFAPDNNQKNTLLELSKNKDTFREKVGSKIFNLAQLIESISPEHPVCPVPFEVLLEGVRALQPRYYSISSSSLVQKDSISLTTAVESVKMAQHEFRGVASNYLLAIKHMQNGEQPAETESPYTITGPRQKYNMSLPIHIRHSHFKMPRDASRPIVMIGPGTGVAPFRAFVQERIKQAESGTEIGNMILFFGCRKEQEDFLYRNDWKEYKSVLGDKFQLYTAFSRQSPSEKVYVQQRLVEHEKSLRSLILDQQGYIYVCGSGRMAREVQSTLGELLNQPLCNGEATIHQLKTAARYQEDVW
ncbi:NADPH--cytochrome P450 reductase [Penicillium frequentans]|nr:NADPH--cytochrome P450 reductase [Penicillium glabrum]